MYTTDPYLKVGMYIIIVTTTIILPITYLYNIPDLSTSNDIPETYIRMRARRRARAPTETGSRM